MENTEMVVNQSGKGTIGTTNTAKVQISRTELTRLRTEENYTIPQLATHFDISESQMKRAMKAIGLSTSTQGRQRNSYVITE